MQTRSGPGGLEARTPHSKWHRVLQWWGRHHLDREDNGEWRDERGRAWGRVTPVRRGGSGREQLRQDVRLGKHAQDLRAEAVTYGGREELRDYYGRGEQMGRGTERRITGARAEAHLAAYEREQADAYKRRRATRRPFWLP